MRLRRRLPSRPSLFLARALGVLSKWPRLARRTCVDQAFDGRSDAMAAGSTPQLILGLPRS
jgi:hypothetical protein